MTEHEVALLSDAEGVRRTVEKMIIQFLSLFPNRSDIDFLAAVSV